MQPDRARATFRGLATWTAAAVLIAGLLWQFPLVRLRPLDAPSADPQAFDPVGFAERFWSDDLQPALADARPIAAVIAAIKADPAAACQSFGRSVGLSRSCIYLVEATGTVAAASSSECLVELDDPPGLTVALTIGPVFGTVVRDLPGTIDPAARADSRDLAAVATEVNRLVQERVIAGLKSSIAPGQRIECVACGQLQGSLPTDKPWKLIPLAVHPAEKP